MGITRLAGTTGTIGATLTLALAAGCAETPGARESLTRISTASFASRTIADVSLSQVQPVAARVFREYFRLDTSASTGTMLISRPAEAGRHDETPRVRESVRDVIGPAPSRQRKMAELRLRSEGRDVIVLCHVQLQRLGAAEQTAFGRERGDDRPNETAINRMGNTSSSDRREEWVNTGRDRKTEQAILDVIQQAFLTSRPAASEPTTRPR